MGKLFIFGIGGSGARVIRSLCMLLGSGVKVNADEVIPILIDPDSSNGDVNRTLDILRIYRSVNQLIPRRNTGFFHTEINSLTKENEFMLHLEKVQNQKFRDYISYHNLGDGNKFFIDLLFSDSNLNLDMQVGFKGNPNIGSVVLNQIKNNPDFRNFANKFSSGDRIFIVSSIFGGTGAGGFPLLLKNIRYADKNVPNHALLSDAKVGALTILPYFGLHREDNSPIEKESFLPKTKAALDYYESKINPFLDSMYYISDSLTKDYPNHEGQSHQKNDAHFVELAGALAILDFLDKSDTELQRGNIFKEYGVVSDIENLQFDTLGKKSRETLQTHLSEYAFLIKYIELKLAYSIERNQTWTIEGSPKFDENFLSSPFIKNYLFHFNSYFEEWIRELGRNRRSFSPFNWNINDKNLFTLIRGTEEKKGFFSRKNFDAFDTELNFTAKKLKTDLKREEKFFQLFERAIQSMIQNKYELGKGHA